MGKVPLLSERTSDHSDSKATPAIASEPEATPRPETSTHCTFQPPCPFVSRVKIIKNIKKAFPDLVDVHVHDQVIRDSLAEFATPELTRVLNGAEIKYPPPYWPKTVQIALPASDLNCSADARPTHVLGVVGAGVARGEVGGSFLPFHHLVYVAHCANFPVDKFPPSSVTAESSVYTVPVVKMPASLVPAPKDYKFLHSYLYLKHASALSRALLADRERIMDTYKNAIALGVVDDKLYKILKEAYDVAT